MRVLCVVAAALVATGARAQLVETSINATGDNNWSATAGRTVGNGNSVLQAEVGWPGVDNNLAVTARVRVGPEFALDSSGTGHQTAFTTLIGLSYNARVMFLERALCELDERRLVELEARFFQGGRRRVVDRCLGGDDFVRLRLLHLVL